MCDLICDVMNYCASSFGMQKNSVYDQMCAKQCSQNRPPDTEAYNILVPILYLKLMRNVAALTAF